MLQCVFKLIPPSSQYPTHMTMNESREWLPLFRWNESSCLWSEQCEQAHPRKAKTSPALLYPVFPQALPSSVLPGRHVFCHSQKTCQPEGTEDSTWYDHRMLPVTVSAYRAASGNFEENHIWPSQAVPSATLSLSGGGFWEIQLAL